MCMLACLLHQFAGVCKAVLSRSDASRASPHVLQYLLTDWSSICWTQTDRGSSYGRVAKMCRLRENVKRKLIFLMML